MRTTAGKDRRSRTVARMVVVFTAAFATLLAASFARAHHSFSVFDMKHGPKMLEGEIAEFQWTNPHTWTWLDVKNADGTVDALGSRRHEPELLGPPRLEKTPSSPATT